LLRIENLNAYYGDMQVLFDVSVEVEEGEIVTIVGANGAGKSSLLRSVSGLMPKVTGTIEFEGEPILGIPSHDVVDRGIVQIPEARQLFPFMSVADKLALIWRNPSSTCTSFCLSSKNGPDSWRAL
jgi:branched-chain amino acid transport system ATP-binding protein